MKVSTTIHDRMVADVAMIEGAVQQLGEGYRDLLRARSEIVQDAYAKGGHNATGSINAFFSDVHIRDRVAAALSKAGLGEVLDVGSTRDHSLSNLNELVDRFGPAGS